MGNGLLFTAFSVKSNREKQLLEGQALLTVPAGIRSAAQVSSNVACRADQLSCGLSTQWGLQNRVLSEW